MQCVCLLHRLICVEHSCLCVCVCVAGIRTDRTSVYLINGLIRVLILQTDQNPFSAVLPVPFLYHLKRLKVDRFPLFWLSGDTANTTYCYNFSSSGGSSSSSNSGGSSSSSSSSSGSSSSGVVVVEVLVLVVVVLVLVW